MPSSALSHPRLPSINPPYPLPNAKDIEHPCCCAAHRTVPCALYTATDRPNVKYVSPDGHREVIYNSQNEIVLDARDIGTYNVVPSGGLIADAGHLLLDIIPWVIFGNGDNDPGPIVNEIICLFE